jgi:hypothetical protein
VGGLLLAAFVVSRFFCVGAWLRYGIVVPVCPDGLIRQTLSVDCQNLRRGAEGSARVWAYGVYTTAEADDQRMAPLGRFEPSLALVKEKGEEIPLPPVKGWQTEADGRVGTIVLPRDLPDGDYQLRARVRSPLGEQKVDVALPVYAPARIHVITDRPLYEPGNTVQFRAVVLRASDLAPIDDRPGKWLVEDPSGERVLEEKAPARLFGVVSGSFPLDSGAPTGDWKVRWSSGGAEDAVTFKVEPFTLPRFHVDAAPVRPFYRAGDRPVVKGRVLYTSGAPVRNAALEIGWTVSGAWPPPTDWQQGGLPKQASTDDSGGFELHLPVVPRDLRGRVTLSGRLAATDAAGDRVVGGASVLLTEHALQVSAVTELQDGLVEGFNNRVYLRATSAGGAVLADTELVVKRAWDPNDPGVTAVTDEDGVAALQLDPGPPVNVVVPPMPVRPPPRPPVVVRGESKDLVTGQGPPMADQLALDRLNGTLAPCARFVAEKSGMTSVGLRVSAAGVVVATSSDGQLAPACLAAALRARRLAPGHERVYQLQYALSPDLPTLKVTVGGTPRIPPGLQAALDEQALDARTCLPRNGPDASLPRVLMWTAHPARKSLTVSWAPDPERGEKVAPPAVVACIERKIRPTWAGLASHDDTEDEEASDGELLGLARLTIDGDQAGEAASAEATTLLGYELSVTARARGGKNEELGSSPLVLRPGKVPPIRLRASPVLAAPGGVVDVAIVRGPDFTGALPRKLRMTHLHGAIDGDVDEESRTAHFKLPSDAQGWFEVQWGGGRALVYVRPRSELAVEIRPGAERYAPGKMAELHIRTTAGQRGTSAAVGLFGVDASLADLAPLPGPDDLARVRPRAKMEAPAFAVLDVGALEMGRMRGTNAATATVLRVTSLPAAAAVEGSLSASLQPTFDAVAVLTDSFYNVLAELHARVRQWEGSAPKGEQMKPPRMAKLWTEALDACEKRKEPVVDAYGRRLRLSRLPADLLALTDPKLVVTNGTRRPEDVENWSAWVQREKP